MIETLSKRVALASKPDWSAVRIESKTVTIATLKLPSSPDPLLLQTPNNELLLAQIAEFDSPI
jgi:hypothetical protein